MPIPNDMYNEYKLDVMLDCYKWDPQFCDNNTVAKYALVLSEKEHEELKLLTEKLIKETNVVGVVTQPDKVVGRKCELSFSPIKKVALANNIKVLQTRF